MTERTPGPWQVRAGYDWVIETQDGVSISAVYTPTGQRALRQDNSRFIAAAPEVLEALEGLGAEGCFCPAGFGGRVGAEHIDRCAQARAALAKSKGDKMIDTPARIRWMVRNKTSIVAMDDGKPVATICYGHPAQPTAEASAHLMSAAPEMLEDLVWALSQLCPHPEFCEANHPTLTAKHNQMQAAVAKAKGINNSYSYRAPCNHYNCEDIADIPIPEGVYYDRLLWTCPKHRGIEGN